MNLLSVRDIVKIYRTGDVELRALDGVSFSVDQGEFVSIMGHSGSGKSTMMNILGCLDVPDEGSYILDGREVASLSRDELADIRNAKIGFVFQGFNLLPRTTALENVELPMIYRGLPHAERIERARAALDRVGLKGREDHHPSQLSGGQQQRVAIARALAGNPAVILADEPTGNLDWDMSMRLLQLLAELNRMGKTIVMATHDLNLIRQSKNMVAARVLRIRNRRVQLAGADL